MVTSSTRLSGSGGEPWGPAVSVSVNLVCGDVINPIAWFWRRALGSSSVRVCEPWGPAVSVSVNLVCGDVINPIAWFWRRALGSSSVRVCESCMW
ncbi:hypothetical protein RRG08_043626 [Elysia crispata]|uniref:Uncharacterized protein n=1 Tax=Elysia crispata TaxID=231223 RepID=A0AAE1A5J1_9GAST|nr:hypothetical protein RRG08_043626 [Elysia crispata]